MANFFRVDFLKAVGSDVFKITEYNDNSDVVNVTVLYNQAITVEPCPENKDTQIRISTVSKQYDIPVSRLQIFGQEMTEVNTVDAVAFFYDKYD